MSAKDRAVMSSIPLVNYLRHSSPMWAALLGTAAYLLLLQQFWPWWMMVLVCPFAFVAAVIVFSLLCLNQHRLSRLVLAGFGIGALVVGLTQTNRIGTLLVGVAVLLISVFSSPLDHKPVNG